MHVYQVYNERCSRLKYLKQQTVSVDVGLARLGSISVLS